MLEAAETVPLPGPGLSDVRWKRRAAVRLKVLERVKESSLDVREVATVMGGHEVTLSVNFTGYEGAQLDVDDKISGDYPRVGAAAVALAKHFQPVPLAEVVERETGDVVRTVAPRAFVRFPRPHDDELYMANI